MYTLADKRIVFDGNCRVCTGLKVLMIRLGVIKEEHCSNFHALSLDLKQYIDPELFRNEMALLDLQTKTVLYGAEGIGYIFKSRFGFFRLLFSSSFFLQIFLRLYKTIAYNRYIMAVPKNGMECDCFPDTVHAYRLAYILITYGLSSLLTFVFMRNTGYASTSSLFAMPWFLQTVAALIFMKEKRLDYLGHIGSSVLLGSLLLMPAILLGILAVNHLGFYAISLIAAWGWMSYLHNYRSRYLQLGKVWRISWGLFILAAVGYQITIWF